MTSPTATNPDDKFDQDMVNRFVGVCHFDIDAARAMLAEHPGMLHRRSLVHELPIQAAAHVGNQAIMTWLLEEGAERALCTAAAQGSRDEVLAALDADPSLKDDKGGHGMGLLVHAVVSGHETLVADLLERGLSPNTVADGASNDPLHLAVMHKDHDLVALLLEHGADPNAKNYQDQSSLGMAREKELIELVALMEQHA